IDAVGGQDAAQPPPGNAPEDCAEGHDSIPASIAKASNDDIVDLARVELVGSLRDAGIEVVGADAASDAVVAQVVAAVDGLRRQGIAWGIETISFGPILEGSPVTVDRRSGEHWVVTSIVVDPTGIAEHQEMLVAAAIYASVAREVVGSRLDGAG